MIVICVTGVAQVEKAGCSNRSRFFSIIVATQRVFWDAEGRAGSPVVEHESKVWSKARTSKETVPAVMIVVMIRLRQRAESNFSRRDL